MSDQITLRSFRLAFEVERRLHRIDRFRIPVPYGIPLRGIAYGAVALMGVLWCRAIPVLGEAESLIPWPARFLVLPGAVAVVLCRLDYDGRPAHEAALARMLATVRPSTVVSFEGVRRASAEALDDVVLGPDERGTAFRTGEVVGAGRVAFRMPVMARRRGRDIEIQPSSSRQLFAAPALDLGDNERLLLR
jgi:hypothetical protein